MTAEAQKYTREQVESLELAPAAEHEDLEGWTPSLATEEALKDAIEKAFDYRGDVSFTLKSGERIEGYIFNRRLGATLADSWIQYYVANDPAKHKLAYSEIATLEFTGKDRAAGKHWEDWVKTYNEKKAAGETNIALQPEKID
jgi:sugar/nucleoside kinase (ribokinase family)